MRVRQAQTAAMALASIFLLALSLSPAYPAFLSDLAPISTSLGWGVLQPDADVCHQGPVSLRGQPYEKGLSPHADSSLNYGLLGQYDVFYADIGIDDSATRQACGGGPPEYVIQAFFIVEVDGVEVFRRRVSHLDAPVPLEIPVSGVRVLTLKTRAFGVAGIDRRHTTWADPRVERFNRDPVCDAGLDLVAQCQDLLTPVQLDGTLSYDSDEDPIEFAWSLPEDSVAVLADASGATPLGFFPLGETWVSLTVTDGKGGVSVDEVLVTVVDPVPPAGGWGLEPGTLGPPRTRADQTPSLHQSSEGPGSHEGGQRGGKIASHGSYEPTILDTDPLFRRAGIGDAGSDAFPMALGSQITESMPVGQAEQTAGPAPEARGRPTAVGLFSFLALGWLTWTLLLSNSRPLG